MVQNLRINCGEQKANYLLISLSEQNGHRPVSNSEFVCQVMLRTALTDYLFQLSSNVDYAHKRCSEKYLFPRSSFNSESWGAYV